MAYIQYNTCFSNLIIKFAMRFDETINKIYTKRQKAERGKGS